MSQAKIFDVIFDAHGVCVGKMRNEVTNTATKPFQVSRMLATDEGPFQGGDDTSPTPLEFFLTGLVGCLMTQVRVFAKRLKVDLRDLEVKCHAHWEAHPDEVGPYQARSKGFEIDITLNSDSSEAEVRDLIAAAKRACFVEATLAQANEISHSLRINAGEARDI